MTTERRLHPYPSVEAADHAYAWGGDKFRSSGHAYPGETVILYRDQPDGTRLEITRHVVTESERLWTCPDLTSGHCYYVAIVA